VNDGEREGTQKSSVSTKGKKKGGGRRGRKKQGGGMGNAQMSKSGVKRGKKEKNAQQKTCAKGKLQQKGTEEEIKATNGV